MTDDDDHEGRRTVAALCLSAIVGGLAVGAMFWLFGNLATSPLTSSVQSLSTPLASGTAPVAAAALEATPTTATTTFVPPSPSYAPLVSASISLPPPELPTMTAPETTAALETPGQPAPAVTSPVASAPRQPVLSGLALRCTRTGKAVRATFSFTTTAPVDWWVTAGGQVERGTAGPGPVTVTTTGAQASYCMATVGSQRLGPVAAR